MATQQNRPFAAISKLPSSKLAVDLILLPNQILVLPAELQECISWVYDPWLDDYDTGEIRYFLHYSLFIFSSPPVSSPLTHFFISHRNLLDLYAAVEEDEQLTVKLITNDAAKVKKKYNNEYPPLFLQKKIIIINVFAYTFSQPTLTRLLMPSHWTVTIC